MVFVSFGAKCPLSPYIKATVGGKMGILVLTN